MPRAIRDLVLERLPDATSLSDLGSHGLKDLTEPEHVLGYVKSCGREHTGLAPVRTCADLTGSRERPEDGVRSPL